MMTVRFASGLCVQYNDATYVLHSAYDNVLYKKKDGDHWQEMKVRDR